MKQLSSNRRAFCQQSAAISAASLAHPALLAAAEPARPKVRIGVVGGNFGLHFFWADHPESTVTAVCDIREDRLLALKERYRCETGYSDFHELIRDPNVDAVAVFTPAPLHTYQCIQAMEAGKHVVCAVPATCSLEECQQLIDAVHRTGMNYMMAETSYYRYQIIQCRRWAQEGRFGTVFHAEAEYLHEGLIDLMYDEDGTPDWRHGLPPMHYITHCTGMVIPVMGERLTEVTCIGWGDGHEVLQTNLYGNPFWNETAFFQTEGGRSARLSVFWHVATAVVERADFYGDRMSYFMPRAGRVPGFTGHGQPDVGVEEYETPDFWDVMPPEMRRRTPHGGSHTWITHEFVRSIIEERKPAIDVYEAVAYTAPGFCAHQSALREGERIKIPQFG